jgi:hypothetical protein
MSDSESVTSSEDFVSTPLHNLIAVFHDADSLNAAVKDLNEKGFTNDEIRSFIGEEGMRAMDFDGSSHGFAAVLLRYFQNIGPDRTYLARYEKYMQDGDALLMVFAPEQERKQVAAGILRKHSAHRVTYFGALVIEEV